MKTEQCERGLVVMRKLIIHWMGRRFYPCCRNLKNFPMWMTVVDSLTPFNRKSHIKLCRIIVRSQLFFECLTSLSSKRNKEKLLKNKTHSLLHLYAFDLEENVLQVSLPLTSTVDLHYLFITSVPTLPPSILCWCCLCTDLPLYWYSMGGN